MKGVVLEDKDQESWEKKGEDQEKTREQQGDPMRREVNEPHSNQNFGGCMHCGLRNHKSEECRRRKACEMCGFHNHNSYDYKREPLWNSGPELCAAQVPNQSFFYIEEHIDQKAQRERARTAIITVIEVELNAKQIDGVQKHIEWRPYWRWSAKQIVENKYIMRFPTAKLVQDFSRFNLGIKNVNAQIMVELWSSSVGAKGRLQQA
jgi:hypothetical protein